MPLATRIFFLSGLTCLPLLAVPVYQFGTGSIVYGVAPYGGAPVAQSSYIPNNFNGLTDVLTSPGGGYLTASPVIANNIDESGIANLPVFFGAAGGSNGFGNFGLGLTAINGPAVGFALVDANPDGIGAASYSIATWTSTWVENAGYNGAIGAWLAASGTFGSGVSAGALSLRVRVQSAGLGIIDFPELVLAPRANGPCFGINGIVTCAGNSFSGGAITSQNVNIPLNDVLTVFATLTAIADPMHIEIIDINSLDNQLLADLLTQQGPIPVATVVSGNPNLIPEPSTWALALLGLLVLFGLQHNPPFRGLLHRRPRIE